MNEAHIRAVASALMLVDEALEYFESVAGGREPATVFYREHNRLTASQRAQLAAEIPYIRALMEGLRRQLAFAPEERVSGDLIWGRCAVLCDYLKEVSGPALNRYGLPDPAQRDTVTAQLAEIESHLRHIATLVSSSAEE